MLYTKQIMEQPSFSSPEIKKRDVFDDYSLELNYVLKDVSDLDAGTQANYKSVNMGDRVIFVRTDVLADIEKYVKGLSSDEYKGLLHALLPGVLPTVHHVLRPIFRKSYELMDKKKSEEMSRYREEVIINLIRKKEIQDQKRIEVVKFIESFPLDIQQRLKTGAFLIDFEGKYYSSVEEGRKTFAVAESDKDFESKKAGNWKRGLLETLKAGSPYVKAYLPSAMSGVVSSFRAELKDGTVTAVVVGNSFSTFGDNDLSCSVEFNDGGTEKKAFKSFRPF